MKVGRKAFVVDLLAVRESDDVDKLSEGAHVARRGFGLDLVLKVGRDVAHQILIGLIAMTKGASVRSHGCVSTARHPLI